MILRGVMGTQSKQGKQGDLFGEEISRPKTQKGTQGDLFSEDQPEAESEEENIKQVDLEELCTLYPRLALVKKIAEQNHFMHWELEFADLFAEHGGFDLIIGNPPWRKIEWQEQAVLADNQPLLAVHNYSATEITQLRHDALNNPLTYKSYVTEFVEISASKLFLNAYQNYSILVAQKANLYKCFLPQAWIYSSEEGVSAFVHPNDVFSDSNGETLRAAIYPRLRLNFRFINELRLFSEVHHETSYGLCIYGKPRTIKFDLICKLLYPSTIDECYDDIGNSSLPSIKNESGWILRGHKDRLITINNNDLKLFAKIFDDSDVCEEAHLPDIYCKQLLDVLVILYDQNIKLGDMSNNVFTTQFWNETIDKNSGIIREDKDGESIISFFPDDIKYSIYSAPNIASLNPYGSTTRRLYRVNSDYDRVDLINIPDNYLIRCKYHPNSNFDIYYNAIPNTPWGKITDFYRIASREFVGCDSERTLVCAILPPAIAHVNAVFSAYIRNNMNMVCLAGCESSLPYDFFVKCIGKRHINYSTYKLFPLLDGEKNLSIIIRTLLMNCISKYYSNLWSDCWHESFKSERWAKNDSRLSNLRFSDLNSNWSKNIPLRSDYERRQALVEIDVLTSIALGMTLDQLKTIYHIQFPVLQSYEDDTWYDANGRIVFTNNRSMTDVGFSRQEWENNLKGAAAGQKFNRTIIDDTMPGGPVERTIEYVAPFDRCNREKDYEIAWNYFTKKD